MIYFISLLLVSLNAWAALPPTTLKGQDQTKATTFNFESPYNQTTKTASSTGLIETGNQNLLVNANFEHQTVTTGWTVNFSSPTADTTNYLTGKKALVAPTFSGAGTQLEQTYADCSRLYGQNMEASIYIKSTATTGEVCSLSNGTEVQCVAMDSSDIWKQHTLNFPAPQTGSCGIRVKSSGSALVNIRFDNAYLGLARNIGTVAQANYLGTMSMSAGNQSVASTAATKVRLDQASFTRGTGDTANRRYIPGFATELLITATAAYGGVTSGDYVQTFVHKNGARISPLNCYSEDRSTAATSGVVPSNTCRVQITNSTDYIELFIESSDSSYSVIPDGTRMEFWSFPTAAQQVIQAAEQGWYVDANISGANPDLGTSNVASYTEITNSSLTLTPNAGSASMGAVCSGTNAAATPSTSPTTCAAGSEGIGFTTIIPKAGAYEVCGAFTHYGTSTGNFTAAFQWMETPSNAQTILSEGRERSNNDTATGAGVPHRNCTVMNFSSSGQKTLRLMFEQNTFSGTIGVSRVIADASAAAGQRDIHVTMRPWTANQTNLLIIGSVISGSQGVERVERATFRCSASPAVLRQSGNFISSVGAFASGGCLVNFTTAFSDDPTCVATLNGSNSGITFGAQVQNISTSQIKVTSTYTSGGAIVNDNAAVLHMVCMGPK